MVLWLAKVEGLKRPDAQALTSASVASYAPPSSGTIIIINFRLKKRCVGRTLRLLRLMVNKLPLNSGKLNVMVMNEVLWK